MLDLALTESKRLDSYIDNIIQMLKVDSGKLSLNIQSVNSNLFITEINKQKFRFIVPKAPFDIELDPVLFQQVILNLIDNVVKFTCDFEKEILITLKRKKTTFCLFEVQDKGIGLRESDMEKYLLYSIELKKEIAILIVMA